MNGTSGGTKILGGGFLLSGNARSRVNTEFILIEQVSNWILGDSQYMELPTLAETRLPNKI